MTGLFVAIPLLVAVSALFLFGVGRTLVQLWTVHKRKIALLEQFEARPGSFDSSQEVISRIAEHEMHSLNVLRQDYTLTGTCLAALGLSAVFGGKALGYGALAVGLHLGGILCIGLGVLTALVGYLIRALSRPLLREGK